jgi:hypothetical protein
MPAATSLTAEGGDIPEQADQHARHLPPQPRKLPKGRRIILKAEAREGCSWGLAKELEGEWRMRRRKQEEKEGQWGNKTDGTTAEGPADSRRGGALCLRDPRDMMKVVVVVAVGWSSRVGRRRVLGHSLGALGHGMLHEGDNTHHRREESERCRVLSRRASSVQLLPRDNTLNASFPL